MAFLSQHNINEHTTKLSNPSNIERSVVASDKRHSCRRIESINKRISKRMLRIKLDVASDHEMVHDKIEKNERQVMDSRKYDSDTREWILSFHSENEHGRSRTH